jgi:hypothetical protein
MLRGMRRFHLYERMALVRRTMKEAAAAFSKSVNWSSQGRNSTRQPAPTYLTIYSTLQTGLQLVQWFYDDLLVKRNIC